MQNTFDFLNLPPWQVIGYSESEDHYGIQARSCCPRLPCPACGSIQAFKHGVDAQTLHDLPCHGKRVAIGVNRQRYRCVACRKTWFEALPEVDERYFATARLFRRNFQPLYHVWMYQTELKSVLCFLKHSVS
jgi:transposase